MVRPGHRRSTIAWALTVLTMSAVAAACGGGEGGGGEGDRLPDVDIAPLDGGALVSLADVDGPAVINLWATWCVPCRTEIPAFEQTHLDRGDTVRFVGINIGQSADEAGPFIDEVGATYDQFLDPEGYAQTELGAAQLPTTVVVDAEGRIATRHVGAMDQADLDAAIDAALAG